MFAMVSDTVAHSTWTRRPEETPPYVIELHGAWNVVQANGLLRCGKHVYRL